MNIAMFYSDDKKEWNSSRWRITSPTEAINADGKHEARAAHVQHYFENSDLGKEMRDWADVIINQRMIMEAGLAQTYMLSKIKNKTVLLEVDDAYSYMPTSIITYKFWREGIVDSEEGRLHFAYPPYEQLQWGAKIADGIVTPSKVLAEDWKAITPRGYHIPNFIDADVYINARDLSYSRREQTITIGWGGSASHTHSFRESKVVTAIRRILTDHKDFRFKMAGSTPYVYQDIHDRRLRSRINYTPFGPFEEWPTILNTFDIGIIPLAGPYDERRSPIKIYEYMIMGIPFVATRNAMTEEFADMGLLVSNHTDEWINAIMEIATHLDDYREKIRPYREWAEAMDIRRNVDTIIKQYENAINNHSDKLFFR